MAVRSVNDSRYSAESAIRRIGILHWTHRPRPHGARKEKKRDRIPEVRSFPELLTVFGIHERTTKKEPAGSNTIEFY